MIELFPLSAWSIGIFNGFNKDNKPLDIYTIGGVILPTQFIMTLYGTIKYEQYKISTFGSFIASAVLLGSLYFAGSSLGKAVKHTIKNRSE